MATRIFPLSAGKTAWSSTKAQSWSVTESSSASGRRRAICNQLYPKYTFNVTFNVLTDDELATLAGFYALSKGALLPFYYKDAVDYHVEKQQLGASNSTYQCVIKSGDYVEPCQYVTNLHVYVDGTEVTDYTETNGVITVGASVWSTGSVVTASYDYYWYVRFEGDLSVTQVLTDINKVSLKLVTVR